MRSLSVVLVAAAFVLQGLAAAPAVRAADREIVMFSTKGCVYCRLFDREVAPGYSLSAAARKAPLRRVDIDGSGTGGYSLKTDITVTPTFVLFRQGREVGRIPGYPGKQNFYRMLDYMFAQK